MGERNDLDRRYIVRNEFREVHVERLRGLKCVQGTETRFVGNTMTNICCNPCQNILLDRYLLTAGPTAAKPPQRRAAAEWRDKRADKQTDRQTDRQTDAWQC